MGNAEQVHK